MSHPELPPGYYPSYDVCTEVSPICPVWATTLGYYPIKGLNIFLAIAYGIAAIITIVIGVWKRTWGFSIAVAAGCILECVGTFPLLLAPFPSTPFNPKKKKKKKN